MNSSLAAEHLEDRPDTDPLVVLTHAIAGLCEQSSPEPFHATLLAGINELDPELHFRWVLSRGGWYRLGGVIDDQGQPISSSLNHWLADMQEHFEGDLDAFMDVYADLGYRVTHIEGESHYFTAPTGRRAQDFLQLEIEETQEIPVRDLFPADWEPEDWEDLADPMDLPSNPDELSETPRRYLFRRITPMADFIETMEQAPDGRADLPRMLHDWDRSSAGKLQRFCEHWAVGIQAEQGKDGSPHARVLKAEGPKLPCDCKKEGPWDEGELSQCVLRYDQAAGYPFAWYFHLVGGRGVDAACALRVFEEHEDGGYAYLPSRDRRLLEAWLNGPYRA